MIAEGIKMNKSKGSKGIIIALIIAVSIIAMAGCSAKMAAKTANPSAYVYNSNVRLSSIQNA